MKNKFVETLSRRTGGVALLIVLGMLVLLAVIVVAFLTSVTTDLADSKSYEAQINTRMLADSALNLVIGEIRQASTSGSAAWISQPGLVRTYDNQGNTVAYKLYSANQMVVSGSFDPNAGTDLPSGGTWMNQPNLYTDLNSPIMSGTGLVFPIIDGNGMQTVTVGGSSMLTYSVDGTIPSVEGFSTNPSQVGETYSSSTALSATNNPVPMPVQWLYMLKDGTLIPATAAGSSKDVTFSGTVTPSGTNPIVARVAFWTDDESCKVNINTASEGVFEDTPVGNTQPDVDQAGDPDPTGNPLYVPDPNNVYEWDLVQRAGARYEYSRYPGHPAQTCLSPVLGDAVMRGLKLPASTGTSGYASNYGYHTLVGTNWAKFAEFFYQLAPRVSGSDASSSGVDYSSRAGTVRAGGTSTVSTAYSASISAGSPVTTDTDRLYANIDEYFYAPTLISGSTRENNGYAVAGPSGTVQILTPAVMERSKFFLTASSKSPEQNLFNLPRVSIWPITKSAGTLDDPNVADLTATTTAFDKVLAFCSTVSGTNPSSSGTNKIPLYFSRYDPMSATKDFGTTNQNLYAYVKSLTNQPFPGFGPGTFQNKYGPDKDQILTEIFDYIRCTNLADISSGTAISYTSVGTGTTTAALNAVGGASNEGQVVPLVISSNNTRGFGRIATIGEMALFMVKEDNRINSGLPENAMVSSITLTGTHYSGTYNYNTPVPNYANVLLSDTSKYSNPPNPPPPMDYSPLPGPPSATTLHGYDPRTQTRIQFVLIPLLFSPMAGYAPMANNVRLHFSNFSINVAEGAGGNTNPFGSGSQPDMYNTGRFGINTQGESKIGGPIGYKTLIEPASTYGNSINAGAPLDSVYPNGELVVNGTSGDYVNGTGGPYSELTIIGGNRSVSTGQITTGSWAGNTITISGSVTVTISAPAVTTNGDPPATVQTLVFSWPQTKVPIPALTIQNIGGPRLYTAMVASGSSESSNPYTQGSATGTNSKAAVTVGNTTINSRLVGWGNNIYDLTASGGVANGINPGNGYVEGESNGDGDSIRSLPAAGIGVAGVSLLGDLRIPAAMASVPAGMYAPMQTVTMGGTSATQPTVYYDPTKARAYGFRNNRGPFQGPGSQNPILGYLYVNKQNTANPFPRRCMDIDPPVTYDMPGASSWAPYVPEGVNGVYNYLGNEGDWDTGPGLLVDGPYVNKPDEGTIRHWDSGNGNGNGFVPTDIAPEIGHDYAFEDASLAIPTLYSPNRIISSPVMFGSLPTGVMAQRPWQTLLFRPAKSYLPGGNNHPGAAVPNPVDGALPYPPYTTPPDHLLLDLFWMPVVEPYPISEPFATAGKVNLNYQIAPFTYITRKTALRAVLQSVKITAMNPTELECFTGQNFSATYKNGGTYEFPNHNEPWIVTWACGAGIGISARRNIDLENTLRQIDEMRFGTSANPVNKPFITASEICDIPLIPADQATTGISYPYISIPYNINSQIQGCASSSQFDPILKNFWWGDPTNITDNQPPAIPQYGHRMTGDNALERPYSMIYPRLTTKSNTYTVHVRVQTLKKSTTTPVNVFKDGQDQVVSEFRGSFVVERYLDPATAGIYLNGNVNNPVTMSTPNAQLGPYKFRVISSKQFGQ